MPPGAAGQQVILPIGRIAEAAVLQASGSQSMPALPILLPLPGIDFRRLVIITTSAGYRGLNIDRAVPAAASPLPTLRRSASNRRTRTRSPMTTDSQQ